MKNWINRQWISVGGSNGVLILFICLVVLGLAIKSLF